jgi:REP element-mobilizing transposase RayT
MTYDPRIHHRRSIRLRGHDYRGGGAYFVTCCVDKKECLFGRVVESAMLVNECGELIQRAWAAIPQRFPSVVWMCFR